MCLFKQVAGHRLRCSYKWLEINKSTHAYSIINVVFRVSFYGYAICFT
uniref:Uncharacterized protein n=1 Tax=Aegilops tauschii subsp. strangulata TaxID=200361 RepID=A0A453JQ61_AEGTS